MFKKLLFIFILLFTISNVYAFDVNNNYIIFNDEVFRIISNDKPLKIIRNESIGKFPFDINYNIYRYSSLRKLLNSKYYYSIHKNSRKLIKNNKWEGSVYDKIGLISMNEYLNSNKNKNCKNLDYFYKYEDICVKTNYFNKMFNDTSWTLSSEEDTVFYIGDTFFPDFMPYELLDVHPTFYLKNNIKLTGKGMINNPFRIAK